MNIRNNFGSLQSLLGVQSAAPATGGAAGAHAATTEGAGLNADSATVSSAGSEVAQAAGEDGVRMDKVSSVQSALAAGSYNVPASAVASKVVDAMLGGSK